MKANYVTKMVGSTEMGKVEGGDERRRRRRRRREGEEEENNS